MRSKLLAVLVPLALLGSAPPTDRAAPADVVSDFNESITRQDRDAAMALLADGSVQFNLRSSHADMGEQEGLTQDLHGLWAVVTSLLFNTLESYERTVEVTDEHVAGDVATVWTDTRTETLARDASAPSVLEFSEVYLLLRLEGEWRIAGVANNRPTTRPEAAP